MITLPEPTYTVNKSGIKVPTKGGNPAFNAGFNTIDEISRERIKRAASKIKMKMENYQIHLIVALNTIILYLLL